MDRTELPSACSARLSENYDYFREQLSDVDPEMVYRGIGRLVVVDVTLDRGVDDPQLIFESLNSTGMDLSQSDLIRNFILMRLAETEQTRLYETYWRPIETLFRGAEGAFDTFIRDYIALRTEASRQERADEIYFAFRREFGGVGTEPGRLDELMQELLRYARYYAAFSLGADAPPGVREPLARLKRLVDVPATLIMRLFECFDVHASLSKAQFVDAVELVESYVFRRAICGAQTRGYWQVFANLAYRLDVNAPAQSLAVHLARLPHNYRFPDDDEFREALEGQDLYHKRVCRDLLDRLENAGTKEPTDTSKYSIEHIMPQNENLRAAWRDMLGRDWRSVQREWLHRLGNLTLTGYNSTYSDTDFAKKKTIEGGFEESSVRLNKYVREQEHWTPTEMEARGKRLAKRALGIWRPLEVDEALILAAEAAEIQELAARRDVAQVPMTSDARKLFAAVHDAVLAIDPDIIALAEQKSVSYHAPPFFVEVLPRKYYITLLLALDYAQAVDAAVEVYDAAEWTYVRNASRSGGVIVEIEQFDQIANALPLIRQAWEAARA